MRKEGISAREKSLKLYEATQTPIFQKKTDSSYYTIVTISIVVSILVVGIIVIALQACFGGLSFGAL